MEVDENEDLENQQENQNEDIDEIHENKEDIPVKHEEEVEKIVYE